MLFCQSACVLAHSVSSSPLPTTRSLICGTCFFNRATALTSMSRLNVGVETFRVYSMSYHNDSLLLRPENWRVFGIEFGRRNYEAEPRQVRWHDQAVVSQHRNACRTCDRGEIVVPCEETRYSSEFRYESIVGKFAWIMSSGSCASLRRSSGIMGVPYKVPATLSPSTLTLSTNWMPRADLRRSRGLDGRVFAGACIRCRRMSRHPRRQGGK